MNTSLKRIFGVGGIAALVILLAWYLAVFSPQARDLSKAHKAHAAAEQRISQLQGQVVQLNALKSQIPADQAALAVLNAAVPDSPQLDSTLRQLHDAADSSGISLSTVSPSAPTNTASTGQTSSGSTAQTSSGSTAQRSSGVSSISLTMSGSGSYSQVTSFLTQLSSMPRTVVVTGLNLSGTGGQLTAQITANMFYTGA
jgi:Tfp pilus assembly protein PilO